MKKLLISFEFYPPKSKEGKHHLLSTALALTEISPDFFSITFGAGGSTQEGTLDAVKMLKNEIPISVAPHISCMGLKRDEIIRILHAYKSLGIKRIVALRGDLPSGMGSIGELKYANELVALVRFEFGNYFHIEVAAYPEIHPQAKNAVSDVFNLKRKFEAGANSAITQYFFNPDAYFYFVEECVKQQIYLPIVPGIMPILHFKKLVSFSENCGAEIPRWLYKRLESYGDDIDSIRQYGLEVIYQLCERLISGGAPGLHFYTLNQAELCLQLLGKLNLDKRKWVDTLPEVVNIGGGA